MHCGRSKKVKIMLNRDGLNTAFEDRWQEFINFILRSDARR
jgi:hypothetical protein